MNQIWFWIGFLGMAIGAVMFGSKSIATRRREGMEFHLESFFICLTAATLYLTLATNLTVINFKGESISLGRYIDWSITTPLLIIELGVLAGLRPKLLVGVVLADLYMILTGLIANLEAPPMSFVWWLISTGAFIAIFARQRFIHLQAMNIQSQYRLGIILTLLIGFGAAIGLCHLYQSVSSQPVFPIDKDTLTMTRADFPENSEI